MFFDGANKYATTAAAARYSVGSGNHEWYIAPSGTAGNSISFTQAMTLDASGNLDVGNSSTAVSSTTRTTSIKSSNIGNLVLGITQNAVTMGSSVTAADIYTTAALDMRFGTNSTERARIDASGNLLVGTTSSSAKLTVNATGDVFSATSGADALVMISKRGNNGDHIRFLNSSSVTSGNIGVTGTTTYYNTSSDYRLKENVAPMQNALDTISQLNPVTYTWKADGSAGQGFIAHELQAVVPDCVTGEKDAVDETGNPQYQGVDTSFLVATLVAALQELKAEVDSLRAQLNP